MLALVTARAQAQSEPLPNDTIRPEVHASAFAGGFHTVALGLYLSIARAILTVVALPAAGVDTVEYRAVGTAADASGDVGGPDAARGCGVVKPRNGGRPRSIEFLEVFLRSPDSRR
jgi:hypothetical protein